MIIGWTTLFHIMRSCQWTKYLHFFDLYRTNLIWLGKNWDKMKRYKNIAEAQFSSEPRKIFLFTFFNFFRVFGIFFVFFGFFQKKMKRNEIPTNAWILPSLRTILIPTLRNFPSLGTKFCRCLQWTASSRFFSQIIVSEDGVCGMNYEHTTSEGVAVVNVVQGPKL